MSAIKHSFSLYLIEGNVPRRATIVATLPLLFFWNLSLMILGVALFWWKNQTLLFKSAAHYWHTSERWVAPGEAASTLAPVELGPDGKEWAKTEAGYKHVEKVAVPSADGFHGSYPWWHGWAVREAFVAGAEWQEKRPRWQPIETAPRDGTNILIRFGEDGVSQAKFIAVGLKHPWQFIDTNDGITWLVNYAVDGPGGPSHWMPLATGANA